MDGSITSHTETLAVQGDRITTTETEITQVQGQIAEKANTSYVDGEIAGLLGVLDPLAVDAASQSGAEGLLNALLDADAGRRQALMANARVATAERTLVTHASAIAAEAIERLILAAQVDGNAAALVSEASTRAATDSAIAQLAVTLQARLDSGDYAAVKSLSEATADAVDGVSARYLLQVDANGKVAGIQLASGAGGSSAIWLADKLLFAMPDGSGTPQQVMVVGMVNGTPSLGLDGNLIVDGTVVARHMAVDSLSAISATIGVLRTATSGARTEIRDNVIKVFDAANTVRVKIGNLAL